MLGWPNSELVGLNMIDQLRNLRTVEIQCSKLIERNGILYMKKINLKIPVFCIKLIKLLQQNTKINIKIGSSVIANL